MTDTNYFEQLIDNLSTAVLVLNAGQRLEFISSSAQSLLELSESRYMDCRLEDLFPGQLGSLAGAAEGELPDSPFTHRGVTITTPSDHQLVVDWTVSPLLDSQRNTVGQIIEIHPVDRILRINREEGLIASQETTRALIRGLAHEIKNPLGGVRGAAQLLARELPDPALEEYTRIIIEESDRLRDLVDRMLGPHRQPQLAPLNIHEVLEHTRSLLQAETGDSVIFERDYDPSLPNLQGDRGQLIQAVLNIVRNAVQATECLEGERIVVLRSRIQRQLTIGSHRHRLVCRIDIIDNGPGIAEEVQDSLFIPMVSGRPEGSGLGLAISQSIINRHRGLIECHSEPGCTEFTLYLPVESNHAEN